MADLGFGATLHVYTTPTVTSGTLVGEIQNIGFANGSRDSVDVSSMDSTSMYRQYKTGMIDPGELTVEMNFDGNSVNESILIFGMMTSITNTYYWGVTLNDGTVGARTQYKSEGFVTQPGPVAIPFDGKVSHSFTVKLTGVPTYVTTA